MRSIIPFIVAVLLILLSAIAIARWILGGFDTHQVKCKTTYPDKQRVVVTCE